MPPWRHKWPLAPIWIGATWQAGFVDL